MRHPCPGRWKGGVAASFGTLAWILMCVGHGRRRTGYIAPRYAARFRCIGAECEETCCSGWEVPVDEEHYTRLEQKMQGTSQEREEFRSGFASPPTSVDGKGKHALIVLKEDGGCHFLSEDWLCSLQKRYGGDVLSDTCATYPRQVKLVGERIELTAKVSCPEVARLLLLVPDACEVVEIGPTSSSAGSCTTPWSPPRRNLMRQASTRCDRR